VKIAADWQGAPRPGQAEALRRALFGRPEAEAPKGWERAHSLSLTESAAVLGLSRSTVYAWASSGRLRLVKDHLGDHRVLPGDLQVILAEREAAQGVQEALFG